MGIGKLLGQPVRPAAAVPGGSAADEPDQLDVVPLRRAEDHLDLLPIVMTRLAFELVPKDAGPYPTHSQLLDEPELMFHLRGEVLFALFLAIGIEEVVQLEHDAQIA